MSEASQPHVLREYAFIADGERGAVMSPSGDVAWLCFPSWDDNPVFATLLGGRGCYRIAPTKPFVSGGHYEPETLIWRNRWTVGSDVVECIEALAFPGARDLAVLARRVVATQGPAEVAVSFEIRDDFGDHRAVAFRQVDG